MNNISKKTRNNGNKKIAFYMSAPIVETDKQAKRRFEILMKQMLETNPIDKNLKNTDPLKWTGLMNNYKHTAEEFIFKELIYC